MKRQSERAWAFIVAALMAVGVTACGDEEPGPGGGGGECSQDTDCGDEDVCTDHACVNGACVRTNNTASCDDGDACTEGDRCDAGTCRGEAKDCAASTSDCAVGACDPDTGACTTTPANEGERCSDSNACTVNDVCDAGRCRGQAKDCSAFGNACNAGVCNTSNGACQAMPINERMACDDGNACTEGDTCALGRCQGQAKDCSSLTGDCTLGQCDSASGACTARSRNEGQGCDDADACTLSDTCRAGICRGQPRDCSALDSDCAEGACDPAEGSCVAAPLNEGEGCDDADACTLADTCAGGACVGQARDCGEDSACLDVGCDPGTGECTAEPVNEGETCDGGMCALNASCEGGVCVGTEPDCDTGAACAVGVCDEGIGCTLEPMPEGAMCDDGNTCTFDDACTGGLEDACVGRTMGLLYTGTADPVDEGWLRELTGNPTVTVGGTTRFTTAHNPPTTSTRLVYRRGGVLADRVRITFQLRVFASAGRDGDTAALTFLGALPASGGTLSAQQRAQSIYFTTNTIGWGDDSGSWPANTTDALHTYTLDITGTVATVTLDGVQILQRSDFQANGVIGFGDTAAADGVDGSFAVGRITQECR